MDGSGDGSQVVVGGAYVVPEVLLGHLRDPEGVPVAAVLLLGVGVQVDGHAVEGPVHGGGGAGVDDAHQLHGVAFAGADDGLRARDS